MRTCIKHIDIFAETGWVRGGSLLLEGTRIAGIFPARQAAKVKPIEALRAE